MIKRRITGFVTLLVAATTLLSSTFTSGVFAATTGTSGTTQNANGYKISPVVTNLTMNPGTNQTVTLYIQNVSSAVENLQVVLNDFGANSDESGSPSLLLTGQNAPSHGLKQYVTVPKPTFSLQPNAQQAVSVVISIPKNATAGGYYGAVRFAPANINAANNVTLAASVASLVLVKVPGNIKEQMGIASFDARSKDSARTIFTSPKNIDAVVRFQNSGDVQEQPFGKIILKKGGKTLQTLEVNNTDPRGNVLPDSIRKFSLPINKVGSFGKYTLQGNFGYGSNGQLLAATTTFYVIPVPLIIALIVIVAIILFLIFELPRLIKRYNRRIISRAGRR